MNNDKINELLKAELEKASPGITECKTDEELEQYFNARNIEAANQLTTVIDKPIDNNQNFIIPLERPRITKANILFIQKCNPYS